jgi:hypothetical protein
LKAILSRRVPLLMLASICLVVAAVVVSLLLISNGSSSRREPSVVSADEVLDEFSLAKMNEIGLYVFDDHPDYPPEVTLAEAADYLEDDAGVVSLRGALVVINTTPDAPPDVPLRGTVAESLAWAIRVDTSGSTVPDLFDPAAARTIAFVDAFGSGLLGVITQ